MSFTVFFFASTICLMQAWCTIPVEENSLIQDVFLFNFNRETFYFCSSPTLSRILRQLCCFDQFTISVCLYNKPEAGRGCEVAQDDCCVMNRGHGWYLAGEDGRGSHMPLNWSRELWQVAWKQLQAANNQCSSSFPNSSSLVLKSKPTCFIGWLPLYFLCFLKLNSV